MENYVQKNGVWGVERPHGFEACSPEQVARAKAEQKEAKDKAATLKKKLANKVTDEETLSTYKGNPSGYYRWAVGYFLESLKKKRGEKWSPNDIRRVLISPLGCSIWGYTGWFETMTVPANMMSFAAGAGGVGESGISLFESFASSVGVCSHLEEIIICTTEALPSGVKTPLLGEQGVFLGNAVRFRESDMQYGVGLLKGTNGVTDAKGLMDRFPRLYGVGVYNMGREAFCAKTQYSASVQGDLTYHIVGRGAEFGLPVVREDFYHRNDWYKGHYYRETVYKVDRAGGPLSNAIGKISKAAEKNVRAELAKKPKVVATPVVEKTAIEKPILPEKKAEHVLLGASAGFKNTKVDYCRAIRVVREFSLLSGIWHENRDTYSTTIRILSYVWKDIYTIADREASGLDKAGVDRLYDDNVARWLGMWDNFFASFQGDVCLSYDVDLDSVLESLGMQIAPLSSFGSDAEVIRLMREFCYKVLVGLLDIVRYLFTRMAGNPSMASILRQREFDKDNVYVILISD